MLRTRFLTVAGKLVRGISHLGYLAGCDYCTHFLCWDAQLVKLAHQRFTTLAGIVCHKDDLFASFTKLVQDGLDIGEKIVSGPKHSIAIKEEHVVLGHERFVLIRCSEMLV